MRQYVIGSLIGHVVATLVGAALSDALRHPPPEMDLIRVGLLEIEPARAEPPRIEPEPVREEPEPEPEKPKPEPEKPKPEPVRKPPPEVERPAREVKPETIDPDPEPAPKLDAPDTELPREPEPKAEEPIELPEPAAVQTPATETSTPEISAAEPEQVAPGAAVQATATAGVDDGYLRLVQQKIGRRWDPSPAHAAGRAGARVSLRFRILASGQVAEVSVVASSGLSVFDREAREAIISSSPLPRPPQRFGSGGIEITFHFVYNP